MDNEWRIMGNFKIGNNRCGDAINRVSTVTKQKDKFECLKNFLFYRKSVVLRRFFEIFIFKERFGIN